MGVAAESIWFIGYICFEFMVWGGAWYFFSRIVKKGPDLSSPVIGSEANPSAGGGLAQASFAKPSLDKSR